MKTSVKSRSSGFVRIVLTAASISALWIAAFPLNSLAALQGGAGNTIIRNTVTVNYRDAGGNAQTAVTSTVQITVNTVAAAPSVVSFSPASGSTDGTGDTDAYSILIRTNSNGPGAISFATADGTFTNVSAGTGPTVPGDILLGSTIIDPSDSHIGAVQSIAAAGTITFTVPNDGGVPSDSATTGGGSGDGVINGLTNGDTVYLHDGTNHIGPFTVSAVTDPVPGSGTTATPGSIQLTNSSGASISITPAYGWMIVEAKTVSMTVTQGTITDPTQPASWVTTITATMSGLDGTGTVTTSAHAGLLSVIKEISTDGSTFTTSPSAGVNPGATLYYRITVTNTGSGNATSVVLTDPQPTYTTYLTNSGKRATGGAVSYAAAPTNLTDANDLDDYDFGITTANTATYSIGTIAPGAANAVQFFFQVTVN